MDFKRKGFIGIISNKNLVLKPLLAYPIYDMIYLLTAIGLSPGGSSTVHIYTQTVHRTTQNKLHRTTQQFGRVRAVPRLG